MYQRIHEKISVAGVYAEGKFAPKKFQWKNQQFQVQEVTFVADLRDGGTRQRQYSVLVTQPRDQVFRLLFNRDDENWWLEEVWDESALAAH